MYAGVRPTAGERECVFPLVEVSSLLTGRRAVGLPFTDQCGPLFRDAESVRVAWKEVLRQGEHRGWKYIEFRDTGDWLAGNAGSTSYFGHLLDLDAPETELWRMIDDGTRRAVKKAQRSGLTVEFSQEWPALGDFYGLVCRTRRRQGLPPQPIEFFRYIHQHIVAAGNGIVALVRHEKQPIAGAVYFRFRDTALYKFGASDFRFQHLRANNLVMWEAIRRLKADGAKRLDFGRTSEHHESLRRFKRSWGAQEVPLRYTRYDVARRAVVAAPDKTSGWHTHAFRFLPGSLSRTVGRLLYRHFA